MIFVGASANPHQVKTHSLLEHSLQGSVSQIVTEGNHIIAAYKRFEEENLIAHSEYITDIFKEQFDFQ